MDSESVYSELDTGNKVDDDESCVSKSYKKSKRNFRAIYVAIAASAVSFHVGYAIGFSSPAARDMENDESMILSAEDISWFNTLLAVAAVLGGLISIPVAQYLGRRTMVLIILLMFAIGWLLIFTCWSVPLLYLGRIFTGLAFGTSNTVVPVYCGEVSPPALRGSLGTLYNLFLAVGIPVSFIFGTFFEWRTLAQIAFTFVIISGLITFTLPESHYWLVTKQRYKQARKSLRYFKFSNDEEITKEIESIKACIKSNQTESSNVTWRDMREPQFYKPVAIVVSLNLFQQLSGVNGVFYNIHYIFKAANFENENYASILVGMIQVFAIFVSLSLIERTGRRKLMLLSSIGSCISLVMLGAALCVVSVCKSNTAMMISGASNSSRENALLNLTSIDDTMMPLPEDIECQDILDVMTWLSLASSLSFIVFFALGLGPIAFVAVSEILPLNCREFGSGMASLANGLSSVVIIKTFKNLTNIVQLHGVFWIYAVFCLFSACYVYYCLPETQGKTLLEINDIFTKSETPHEDETKVITNDSDKLLNVNFNEDSKKL